MSTTETRYCYRHPDRPTGLSCSVCGRPICTDCMTAAPVGLRCPDHAGGRSGPRGARRRPAIRVPRASGTMTNAPITKALIAINVAKYLLGAVQGAGLNNPGGRIYAALWLDAYDVHNGGWWRLITTAFLHANVLHIAFNMLALWWIGAPVEQYLGRARYVGLYFVAGLAGSAGALLQTPFVTVGASGAIFGILGAMLILEYQATGRLTGNAMTWIVINLVLSFTLSAISWGGHVGGLIGGILATLAYARFGRGHVAYGKLGYGGVIGLAVVAVVSVAIAYWRVRGYA